MLDEDGHGDVKESEDGNDNWVRNDSKDIATNSINTALLS